MVDVTNHDAKVWFDQAANFYTATVHIVERFTLIDQDTMHYQVTIDDPNVTPGPGRWHFRFAATTNADFVCWKRHTMKANGAAHYPWLQDLPRYEYGWAMTRATRRSV